MKFNFSTSLTGIVILGAEVKIDKVDISVSMEMADEACVGVVELVYEQLNGLFGMASIKSDESEEPVLNGSSPL